MPEEINWVQSHKAINKNKSQVFYFFISGKRVNTFDAYLCYASVEV